MQDETIEATLHRACARRVESLMKKLAAVDPLVKFFMTWTLNLDETFYILRKICGGFFAFARFTECLWIVGAAESGKDLVLGIIQSLAGEEKDGLTAVLPFTYVTDSKSQGRDAHSAFLQECAGARFIIVSEVPNRPLTLQVLKPLCEQRGARMASRGLYGDGGGFRPTALPILTSNFTPTLIYNEQHDSGATTRVRLYIPPFKCAACCFNTNCIETNYNTNPC